MKIISANRSDTFDEYLRIISRYNENNLVKEGSYWATGREAFEGAERLTGKGAREIASDLAAASAKSIDPARFAKAGVSNANELKRIFSLAEDLLTGDKFLIEEGGRLRRATPDELSVINEWATRNPGKMAAGNNMSFNAGIGPTNPAFKKVKNVTQKNAVDLAKELQTGSKFTLDEGREFRKITADLIGEPVPTRAVTEAESGVGRAATEAGPPAPIKPSEAPGATALAPGGQAQASSVTVTNVTNITPATSRAGKGASGVSQRQLDNVRKLTKDGLEEVKNQISGLEKQFENMLNARDAALREQISKEITSSINSSLAGVTKQIEDGAATTKALEGKISELQTVIDAQAASRSAMDKQLLEENKKLFEELSNLKKDFATSSEQMKNMKKELEDAARASKVAASEATPVAAKVTWWTKAKNAAVTAAAIAAAVAGSYWLYSKLTEDEEGSEGGDGSSNTGGDTGVPEDRNDSFKNQMDDPIRRQALMDNVEKLKGEETPEGTALLNRMVDHYGAAGFVKLDKPISINGMEIRYVFPVKVSGGFNPVKDLALKEASKSYMNKIYTEEAGKYIYTTTRFASEAGSSDPQKIANYAFSIIAGDKQFSSKGTFLGMGERGKRYGRGKKNVAIGDFGMAGTSEKKMTREERRAIENMNRISDADDFMQNDIDDPMQAFASGQNEFFHKKAENINTSTNKYQSYEFAKKADKISNRYFKDAVQDLQDDEFMKAYYSGFSKLHNEKPKKKKPDYEKLYDLHDETGADLVHEAHPKAITVAEAIGKGGLVENGSERSKAMEDVAFRVPSGNYRARYAFIQEALKKKS